MTSATMVAARYAYVVDETEGGNIADRVEEFAKEKGRERLDGWLVDSSLVPVTLDIQDAIPGNLLGLVPGDFNNAMDILEDRRNELDQEAEAQP